MPFESIEEYSKTFQSLLRLQDDFILESNTWLRETATEIKSCQDKITPFQILVTKE